MDRPMRRGDREMVRALVHAVLERGTWGVLATVDDDGQPYGVPVNYVFDGEESILIHGAPEGHKLANLRGNPRASFTVVSRAETLPEEFTTAFESVIAFGRATELAGEEKRSALVRLAARLGPDDAAARGAYIDAGLERVAAIRFRIERLTGKRRQDGRVGPVTPDPDTRSMRERMLAGDPYIADDPELGEASSRSLDLMAAYNASSVRQGPLRRRLLEELLGSIGEGTEIRPPFFVDYGSNITIGARCFANFGLVALDVAAMVGVGAAVTRDLPANVVAVGNPARVVREI